MKKLASYFPDDCRYTFEKLYQGVYTVDYRHISESHIDLLKKGVSSFKQALTKRGIIIKDHTSLNQTLNEIKYPIGKLKIFFGLRNIIDQDTANIFIFFLQEKIKELNEMAKELDGGKEADGDTEDVNITVTIK